MQLEDKTIIITGASSGIGAAAAAIFAAKGARLVIAARRRDRLEAVAADIARKGGKAIALDGDVRDEAFAARLVDTARREFGGLDGAFNNAGTTGRLGPVAQMDRDNWRSVLAVNLDSAFFAAKHQIPALKQQGGGSIVFTSSFVGHTIGLPGMGAYAAAKAGLVGLAQVLATEHGADGIRVNALLPGGTMTEMAGDDAQFHDAVRQMHALKRMADPEEIARAAMFLLSDQSSFVTGTAMLADGGNSITKL
ncbi:SDR family oxidoreductase [Oricola sp.]|uniref:SDR family oxidoreductase n=1 Tax=Oricola sp. TaxID=1979950 RepID=UPI0025FA4503|nr:SDR family oxidoreductase [Oricola sp.]MCI5073665.1 SDR family oxidoreductase [Oricola sp.]